MFKRFNELNKWEKGGLIFGVSEMLLGVGMIIYGTVQERKILKQLAEQNRVDEIIEETNEILDELERHSTGRWGLGPLYTKGDRSESVV